MFRALSALLLCSLIANAATQNTTFGPEDLFNELSIDTLYGFNRHMRILAPSYILSAQTPILVRYALLFAVSVHETLAACDPVALSFFGTKDPIDPILCTPLNYRLIVVYNFHHLYRSEIPPLGRNYGAYLSALGLDPYSKSTNLSTAIGWSNVIAGRAARYFSNDGWNSIGNLSKEDFLQPYQDYTGYEPVNDPSTPVHERKFPLRWQPLMSSDGLGNFYSQVHVTPHLGDARPLILSKEEIARPRTNGPYKYPNATEMHPDDEKDVRRELQQLLTRQTRITREQIAEAYWWENKFFSLGFIFPALTDSYGIPFRDSIRMAFGEMLAQHDALIVAWREKRRHDLVRPRTLIRQMFRGKWIRAYRSVELGKGRVRADEWEPVIRTQPHSEYPSASSVLCSANFEHMAAALRNYVGVGNPLPLFNWTVTPTVAPGSPIAEEVEIKLKSPAQAARRCGQSRLWMGLHFRPAVRDGLKAGKGIGKAAFKHAKMLYDGIVPPDCERCIRS